jgi:pilus assembly protein CpaB
MKPKTIILMVVAVACGLGASYMTSRLLADRKEAPEVVERPKVKVLVALKKIDTGTMIKNPQALFAEKMFDEDNAPKNIVTDFTSLKDCQLKRLLQPGDFVRPEDLLPKEQVGLAYQLPPGYRAFGLRVDVETIAGGFASLPMSRVDIIWTATKGNNEESFSKVLLQNVLVLAADTNDQRGENKAMLANTVTFALTPEECVIASLAQSTGVLRLILRRPEENKTLDTAPTMKIGQLLSGKGLNPRQGPEPEDDHFGPFSGIATKVNIPDVPGTKKPDPVTVKAEPPAPRWRKHTLTIWNGEHPSRHTFYLDENDKVVQPDVLQASPPPDAPGTVQTPPAAQTPPAQTPAAQTPAGQPNNKKSP